MPQDISCPQVFWSELCASKLGCDHQTIVHHCPDGIPIQTLQQWSSMFFFLLNGCVHYGFIQFCSLLLLISAHPKQIKFKCCYQKYIKLGRIVRYTETTFNQKYLPTSPNIHSLPADKNTTSYALYKWASKCCSSSVRWCNESTLIMLHHLTRCCKAESENRVHSCSVRY